MSEKKKKKYIRPAIAFEKKIEAFAATCIANPNAKATYGASNAFGRTCEQIYS